MRSSDQMPYLVQLNSKHRLEEKGLIKMSHICGVENQRDLVICLRPVQATQINLTFTLRYQSNVAGINTYFERRNS